MTRDEARILISDLIEWYTEDVGERLGMSMGKETYMDALEVLWHGPEGELISRADAIEAVAQQWLLEASAESPYVNDDDIDDYRKLAEELLSDIPSAEAVQGWISCSERLPDERQDVYVTVLWDDYGDYITAYGMRTRFGWHLHSNAEGELIKGYTVIAWMPLPTPYKGGDE